MDAGNPSASLRSTDRGGGKAVRIEKSLLGQLIDPGRIGVRMTVITDPLHVVIFGCDPKQVRSLRSEYGSTQQDARRAEAEGRA